MNVNKKCCDCQENEQRRPQILVNKKASPSKQRDSGGRKCFNKKASRQETRLQRRGQGVNRFTAAEVVSDRSTAT